MKKKLIYKIVSCVKLYFMGKWSILTIFYPNIEEKIYHVNLLQHFSSYYIRGECAQLYLNELIKLLHVTIHD